MEQMIKPEENQIQPLLDITTIAAEAERRVDAVKKIKAIALRVTNASDWVDQQGHPYLVSSGAEKVARLFGIWWGGMQYTKEAGEDEKGKLYLYSCTGNFSLQGQTIEAIGTCSSRDPFFAKANGVLKPMCEVDEPNIKKSAYSNCIVNGVTRILGIRNLTWEEVKGGGIDQNQVSKVEYSKGSQGGNASTQNDSDTQTIVWNMLMDMESNSKDLAIKHLEDITSFTGKDNKFVNGLRNIKALKGKRLEIAHSKIKKEYEQWQKAMNEGGDPS